MEIILVSACLLGYNTKYNGGNNYNPLIEKIREKYDIIPICPEQLGGLKTPRVPSEIKGDEVYSKENKNVTSNFLEGSRKVANIALYNRIKKAILKEGSPSCGVHNVYDGNFDNKLIEGNGITTKKLKSLGIECYTIEEFYEKYIENK